MRVTTYTGQARKNASKNLDFAGVSGECLGAHFPWIYTVQLLLLFRGGTEAM